MTNEIILGLLAWGSIINFALLFLWAGVFIFARDLVYGVHSGFYKLSEDSFNTIHYGGMIFYKLLIILFYVVPYLALRIAS